MQNPKARGSPKESPQNVSPRPARKLKISSVELNSPSSSNQTAVRTPKDRSPKVNERKSPRSPLFEKKRPSKLSELESQITKLKDDLEKVKDQLIASESLKREAQGDAEEVKKQLADVSLKLEESQKQVSELVASKEATVVGLENISQENAVEPDSLDSAYDEIRRLTLQLEMVTESEDAQGKQRESEHGELQSLKNTLAETLSLVETMKHELKDSKDSEAQAQELVRDTLLQLEAAKETVNALRSDVVRSTTANDSIVAELEQSRARVSVLEDLVNKLNVDVTNSNGDNSLHTVACVGDQTLGEDVNQLELELQAMKSDVGQLKSALEVADIRYNEERSHNSEQIRNASEMLEQIQAQASLREAELIAELKNASANIEELKANLMDKETELQGITEENESLNTKLKESLSCQREEELENELKKWREHVAEMKANLMDKETEIQSVFEENENLKLQIKKREMDKGVENEVVEVSRAAEQDAMAKLGYMMEEVDKSNRKAARITEQLEAAQTANAEMETELRKLKVQSDQWRKAAEAAASMLSPGSNGKYVERTGSMPLGSNNYSPVGRRISSPYLDDYDEDSFKKKNGNVLKKIGVLWKKPQK